MAKAKNTRPANGNHPRGAVRVRWLNARRRLLLSMAIAAVAALLAPHDLLLVMRLAAGWDGCVLIFLALTWGAVNQCEREEMQQTVLSQDHGRLGILLLVLLATAASLSTIFFLLQRSKGLEPLEIAGHIALSVLTIVCSWLLTHVMFALHYAHRFYRDDPKTNELDATGGLQFPGNRAPDYWDFLYFSFVIGMTSQVSDVQVTSRPMRQLVLSHSVLSFAFNTVILALSISIVAGLL